ncbi:hypothetical protein ACT2CR_00715 [Candidatus Vidania fulgoroideorum]
MNIIGFPSSGKTLISLIYQKIFKTNILDKDNIFNVIFVNINNLFSFFKERKFRNIEKNINFFCLINSFGGGNILNIINLSIYHYFIFIFYIKKIFLNRCLINRSFIIMKNNLDNIIFHYYKRKLLNYLFSIYIINNINFLRTIKKYEKDIFKFIK